MNQLAKPTKPILVVDQLVCTLDDGFRLEQEDTLDALANDVRYLHTKSVAGGQQHILCAFLCGVALARARVKLPKAKRGMHGSGEGGFDNWLQEQFPEISRASLYNYSTFVEIVYLQSKDLAKSLPSRLLEGSPLDFKFPATQDGVRELLGVIGSAMNNKSFTALVRSQKIIREPSPCGGDTGHRGRRRTDAEIAREQAEERANYQLEIMQRHCALWQEEKL
jgi:hypothetical protein